MASNIAYSEEYRLAALKWVDLDAAARLYDETKSMELARRKSLLGDITDARAERIVKASQEWSAFVHKMIDTRTEANRARVALKVLEMRYFEQQSADATYRAERRL